MLDLIASFLIRGINFFFHIMPMSFNLYVGRCLGTLMYFLSGKRSRITYSNLKAAYSNGAEKKMPNELKYLTKSTYKNIGQTFSEILSMTKIDKQYIKKFVNVRNMERIEKASKNPKGMILLSAHFGNWELSTVTSVAKGFPLHLLARDQKMERLNELLNLLRESKGNIVIRKGRDIKNIFRVLHNGKSVGILADQNAGMQGILVDFFGRPASTAVGPYRFAQKSGAWILPAFIHRVNGPYHELILEEPMIIKKDDEIVSYLQKYNCLLEKHIRAHPDQWLWMHKRWKMTPVRKIMVLDDGKKGHLKQSLAVAEQIKRYRKDKGFKPEDTNVEIVKVRFKNKIAKGMFNFAGLFFTSRCQGCLKCLKIALEQESYEALVTKYADIIISCGSTLVGVNRLLKIENYARNLTILDPGFLNRKNFDLIVIPRHDYTEKDFDKKKTVVTELAPNLILGLSEHSKVSEPLTSFGETADKEICIGLLFGGDNAHFSFDDNLAKSVAEEIRAACKRLDGYFCATTSRRTSASVEKILREELEFYPECIKFVSGKNDKDERTIEKILTLSKVVIVSGESISMVSEAVSSGRAVLVFMPNKKTAKFTKYEKFVQNLEKKGYIKIVKSENISETIMRLNEEISIAKDKNSLPDDNERIYEKLYNLF